MPPQTTGNIPRHGLLTTLTILMVALVAALSGCSPSTEPIVAEADYSLPTALPSRGDIAEPATATVTPPTIVPTKYTRRPTYTPRPAPTEAVAEERQAGPLFQAVLLDGNKFDLANTLGTPTLLTFWAPW